MAWQGSESRHTLGEVMPASYFWNSADLYLLPQPSGYSSEMQVKEVLILQIRPEARQGHSPAWPACLRLLPPTRWTDRGGRLPHERDVRSPAQHLHQAGCPGKSLLPLLPRLPQGAEPGGESLGGGRGSRFPTGFPLGNSLSHLPPHPLGLLSSTVTKPQSFQESLSGTIRFITQTFENERMQIIH